MNLIAIIADKTLDSDNDIIDLANSGAVLIERWPLVTLDFDRSKVIGRVVDVDVVDGELKVSMNLIDGNYSGLYPAPGFSVNQYSKNKYGGMNIHSIKLQEVGLCTSPNSNPSIKPLP